MIHQILVTISRFRPPCSISSHQPCSRDTFAAPQQIGNPTRRSGTEISVSSWAGFTCKFAIWEENGALRWVSSTNLGEKVVSDVLRFKYVTQSPCFSAAHDKAPSEITRCSNRAAGISHSSCSFQISFPFVASTYRVEHNIPAPSLPHASFLFSLVGAHQPARSPAKRTILSHFVC